MTAFKSLPFQYQQRGSEITKAVGDSAARMTEQRDQDLENYLANLPEGGGLTSAAIFSGATLTGGGTTLTPSGIDTVDMAYAGSLGPAFDLSTGEWVGSDSGWMVMFGRVTFTATGLGFGQVSGGGSCLESSTSLAIIGCDVPAVPPAWTIGGTYALDAVSYNALLASPSGLLGYFSLSILSPGTTLVDATLVEPTGLQVDIVSAFVQVVG